MNKKEKKKHGMSSYTFRRKVAPWCILAPPIFFTLWLKYYPIVSAFSYRYLSMILLIRRENL